MKIFFATTLLSLVFNLSFGQVTVALKGKVKSPTQGIIYLTPSGFGQEYYSHKYTLDSTVVEDGNFVLKIVQPNAGTYAYRFSMPGIGATGLVFIGPQDQTIVIESFDEYVSPEVVGSKAQNEIRNEYAEKFSGIVKRSAKLDLFADSLYNIFGKNIPDRELENFHVTEKKIIYDADSLFYAYVLDHKGSPVSLWKLIERFNSFGYKEIYVRAYQHLSNDLKKGITGQALKKNLVDAGAVATGSKFPELQLKDLAGKEVKLDINTHKTKLYLIDFWFHSCAPCLRDIAIYQQLYDRYNNSGFEIISISVDNWNDREKWENKIHQINMVWQNYLDADGLVAKKLNISKYPTTFLLNSKGQIIQMDISLPELKRKLVQMNNNIDLYERQQADAVEPG